jgi:hypothetical protein
VSADAGGAGENPFATVERGTGKGEAPGDLLEAEPPVKLYRGDVASVREEPGVVGTLIDPVETCLRQRCADAAATSVGSTTLPTR